MEDERLSSWGSPKERVPWALGIFVLGCLCVIGFDGCFGCHARAFGVSMPPGVVDSTRSSFSAGYFRSERSEVG